MPNHKITGDVFLNKLESNISKSNSRNISLDIIRSIAIAAVLMTHISAPFVGGSFEIGSLNFIWGNIFDSISRIGVPLFVMTSGALMLDEKRIITIKDLFSKRIFRLILLLIIWSGLYAIVYQVAIPVLNGTSINIKSIISSWFFGHSHLWYLYMQIGLYTALPILKKFVCKKNKDIILLYIIISLLSQFTIPFFEALSLHFEPIENIILFINKFELGFFNIFVTYYLSGWYIVHIGISQKIKRYIIYTASTLSMLIIIFYVNLTKNYVFAYSNSNILVFLYSIGVFLAINNLNIKSNSKLFTKISNCSFGIYLIHMAVLTVVNYFLPNDIIAPYYMLIIFIIVFLISFCLIFLLSKIPILKKLIKI